MKTKQHWCQDEFENSRWTPNNSGMWKSGWMAGFEFAKKKLIDIESINIEPWYEEYVRTLGEEETK